MKLTFCIRSLTRKESLMPEIMKKEAFWAPVFGVTSLLIIAAIILIDRYRRPELYSKKRGEKTERRET